MSRNRLSKTSHSQKNVTNSQLQTYAMLSSEVEDKNACIKAIAKTNKNLIFQTSDNLEIAVQAMRSKKVKAAPVLDHSSQLVGLISEKEIVRHLMFRTRDHFTQPRIPEYKDFLVFHAMIRHPKFLDASMTVSQALDRMKILNYTYMPVIEGEDVCGVVDRRVLEKICAQSQPEATDNQRDETSRIGSKIYNFCDVLMSKNRSIKVLS